MSIYLIRHGKTEANERRLYCGSTDLPLSEAGAQELCKLHYSISPTYFITSGMKRTDETLKILFGDVAYTVEPRFREVDFGDFEMHSFEQLEHREDYRAWCSGDNERNVPPNGESGEQMVLRVLEAFSEVEENTLIVAHGGVIAAIMQHCFPQEGKNRYEWQPKNGCGYAISGDRYTYLP